MAGSVVLIHTLALAVLVFAKPTGHNLVLHESREAAPAGWIHTGAASASTRIDMRIALPSEDFAGLEKILYDISTPGSAKYGQHLTVDQVKHYTAPSDESVVAVKAWLSENGITPKTLVGNGDWVGFTTTIEKAGDLFGAEFSTFKHLDTGKEEVRTLSYSIPAILKPHVELVYPMVSFPTSRVQKPTVALSAPKRNISSLAVPSACASQVYAITPACVQALYGIPATAATSPSKNSITVTGYVDEYAQTADLKAFLAQYRPDVSSSTTFKLQTLDGGSNPQGTSLAGLEGNLDVQYTIGIATGVPVYYLSVGNSTDGINGLLDTVNYVSTQNPTTHVMTTSYNWDENTISRALAAKLCEAYAAIGAQGVSVLFSSGDGGVAGVYGEQCTTFVPTFPSGCPYITSVGGTTSLPETAAAFSGGGFSNYFPMPAYQASQVKAYTAGLSASYAGLYNASGRAYPDVAAYGAVDIVNGGAPMAVVGTSCSSPIFASVIGLLNDALISAGKPPLGFLNPWLYSTAASALTDITSASNYGCSTSPGFSAKAGWDPVTGLGTPNFAKLKKAAGL